jgi:anti-sigma factor (TIGR02949 family)
MHANAQAESPSEGCSDFAAALDAVVDGAAEAHTVVRTEAHAAACVPCARRLATARAYRERLRRAGATDEAPATLRERVRLILQAVRGSPTR